MKTIRIFEIRSFIVAAALSVGVSLGFVSPTFANTSVIVNPDGRMIYLDTLGEDVYGRSSNIAIDINDAGRVVGESGTENGSRHAFITGPNGEGITDLGTLGGDYSRAYGINNAGRVVGESETESGSLHAFITGPNGEGMTDLQVLLEDTSSYATDINDAGQVVGGSSAGRSFITGPNGVGMTVLGTLGGHSSYANGINDAGQVVGYSVTGNDSQHAFITGPNGVGMTDLGTLGGHSSHARGINNAGQVVGNSYTENNSPPHAFVTGPNGVDMIDLGTLGAYTSSANDINAAGQIVGNFNSIENGDRPFIAGPNGEGMTDLNSFVDLPEGLYLGGFSGINNRGQVFASIVPEPASYALILAGLGVVGFMARRKKPAGNTVEWC